MKQVIMPMAYLKLQNGGGKGIDGATLKVWKRVGTTDDGFGKRAVPTSKNLEFCSNPTFWCIFMHFWTKFKCV